MKKIFLIAAFALFVFSCKTESKAKKEHLSPSLENQSKTVQTTESATKNEPVLNLFKGNDNLEYGIIYDTSKEKPVAIIQTKDFEKELVQTTAWAKGGEYEADGYKLISKGDKVTLFIKDKEITLSPIKEEDLKLIDFFKGDNGVEYGIAYDTSKEKPVVIIQTKDFEKELVQITAWAKGGEYEADGYKLISKGDKVTLLIKDKKITLSPIKEEDLKLEF